MVDIALVIPLAAFALRRLGQGDMFENPGADPPGDAGDDAALAEGAVSLNDATLAVSGTAADRAAYAETTSVLDQAMPAGVRLGPVDILPARAPRFVWSASATAEGVLLAGFVPNEAARDIVVAAVGAAFSDRTIDDRMVVASGEPEDFLGAVEFALEALATLGEGGVTLDGLMLDVAGAAASVDAFEALQAKVTGVLPPGMEVVAADVTPAEVADYGWSGTIHDGSVELAGFVASMAEA